MILTWWQGLILGLVQGLTEFLPVSSSGHLVLAEHIVGYQPPGVFFEVAVHVATLLSVMVAYRARIVKLIRGLLTGQGREWRNDWSMGRRESTRLPNWRRLPESSGTSTPTPKTAA